MDQLDHRELVVRVAAADADAFQQLFHEFAPRVRAWLGRGLDPARADEVTQEVMVRVWRSASRYDPRRGAVSTWVFTIARNARTDVLRASRARIDPEDPAWVPDATSSPEAEVSLAQRERSVSSALAELPEEQASVLRGAYFGGLSLREIADNESVPLGTVKSRVRLGLERLREHLAPWAGAL